jgi:hypothetical protein
MTYKEISELHSFTHYNGLEKCFRYPTNPIIKLGKELRYYNALNHKLNALRERKKGDKFIIAWQGQWKTDVFEITNEDIKMILEYYEKQ